MAYKDKFKVKSDLDMFSILQKNGRLSSQKLAEKAGMGSTAANVCLKRLIDRDFFEIRAVPKLEKFSEIPMAVIGFSELAKGKVDELEQNQKDAEGIVFFLNNKSECLILSVDYEGNELSKRLINLVKVAGKSPSFCLVSPNVKKFNLRIPENVLNRVYSGLPERRKG